MSFVRLAQNDVVSSSSSLSTGNFSAAVSTGNLIVVRIFYNSATRAVSGITDTKANTYTRAVGPTTGVGGMAGYRQEIWYAKNVTGGTGLNVTATFDGTFSAEKSIAAHEYAGLDTVSPLDVTAAQNVTAANGSSGAATTNSANEMIFGAAVFSGCGSAGSGFAARSTLGCNVTEDRIVATAGSYAATFTNSGQDVIAQMATFRLAGQSVDTTPPSTPAGLAASAVSTSQINLSWLASTDNVGVTGYRVFRGGIQIATPVGTTYSDTGLTASTTYSYTVKAVDAAGNLSSSSSAASATTLAAPDTTPPSTPAGLSASAISQSQINLSWLASTDNVGVTGYRVFRGGIQIATPVGTTFSDTGLTASTTYSYAVRAVDGAGNVSPLSSTASATTPDTTAPSVPTMVSATALSDSQVNVAWTASTDNVGVSGYRLYRGGTLIATTTGPSYSDIGLEASTQYSYAVAAYDAAGNASAVSSSLSVSTLATGSAATYTTTFPFAENPISENANWIGGAAAGANLWGNVQTIPGLAFGVSEPTQYGDPTAILTGTWNADQTAEATVVNSSQSGSCCKELEVRLRTTISSASITGYEAYCSVMSNNPYCHIASWGGAVPTAPGSTWKAPRR